VEIPMRKSRLVLSLILVLVGVVWIGQGLGIIGGSAMSGSNFWAVAGVVFVAAAAAIMVLERRRTAKG
jgi:glucose dehydrogenase